MPIFVDVNHLNCEFDNKHSYTDSVCVYCGWSRIAYEDYNKFDGWFPYACKNGVVIYWSNYRCNGLKPYAQTFMEYEEIWRHYRDLPVNYSKHIYYAVDNLMENPLGLTGVEVRKYKRCNECRSCIMYHSRVMIAKLMDKATKYKIKVVYMWTFGTNLPDLPRHRVTLRLAWQKTCVYLSNWYKRAKNKGDYSYSPIFKVIETGFKAQLLHVHAIFTAPIDFHLVRSTWARYIKIKNPNVNYTNNDNMHGSNDPIKAFAYLAKYTSKTVGKSRNWSFMGKFYGNSKS